MTDTADLVENQVGRNAESAGSVDATGTKRICKLTFPCSASRAHGSPPLPNHCSLPACFSNLGAGLPFYKTQMRNSLGSFGCSHWETQTFSKLEKLSCYPLCPGVFNQHSPSHQPSTDHLLPPPAAAAASRPGSPAPHPSPPSLPKVQPQQKN